MMSTARVPSDGGQRVRLLVGGASYSAEIVPTARLDPDQPWVNVRLLESVGSDAVFTADQATSHFAAGTVVVARPAGEFYQLVTSVAPLACREETSPCDDEGPNPGVVALVAALGRAGIPTLASGDGTGCGGSGRYVYVDLPARYAAALTNASLPFGWWTCRSDAKSLEALAAGEKDDRPVTTRAVAGDPRRELGEPPLTPPMIRLARAGGPVGEAEADAVTAAITAAVEDEA